MTIRIALLAAALLAAPLAQAQFAKVEDAIKYRQSAMFIKGQHMGRIGQMANGRIPFDAKLAQESAEVVVTMSSLLLPGYPAGSEGGKAKPEIWKDMGKFKEYAETDHVNAKNLLVATKTGDIDKIKAAVGAAGSNCKACHDAFRN